MITLDLNSPYITTDNDYIAGAILNRPHLYEYSIFNVFFDVRTKEERIYEYRSIVKYDNRIYLIKVDNLIRKLLEKKAIILPNEVENSENRTLSYNEEDFLHLNPNNIEDFIIIFKKRYILAVKDSLEYDMLLEQINYYDNLNLISV